MAITLGTDGYCQLANVQALNQQRTYDSNSKPTDTQVEGFITQIFWEINFVLDALGYTVPVPTTATKASIWLKRVNTLGAAAEAERAAFSVGARGENTRADSLQAEYNRLIKMLQDGKATLIDATRGDDSIKAINEKSPTGKFNLDTSGIEREPTFTRTMDF